MCVQVADSGADCAPAIVDATDATASDGSTVPVCLQMSVTFIAYNCNCLMTRNKTKKQNIAALIIDISITVTWLCHDGILFL